MPEHKSVKWTMVVAAKEFNIHKDTLSKRLSNKNIQSGPDGRYSTADICKAVYDDGETARTALNVEKTATERLKKLSLAKKTAPVSCMSKALEEIRVMIIQKVQESTMPDKDKSDLVKNIQSVLLGYETDPSAIQSEILNDSE